MFQVQRKQISCLAQLVSLVAASLVAAVAASSGHPYGTTSQQAVAPRCATGSRGLLENGLLVQGVHQNNKYLAIAPLSVTPVLFMADGTEYPLATVQVPPTSVVTVVINDALASPQPHCCLTCQPMEALS
jgi:hypothetical protein